MIYPLSPGSPNQRLDQQRSTKTEDAYHDGKLSKPRFKLRAGKKRMRVISAEVPADDAIAIINIKSATL